MSIYYLGGNVVFPKDMPKEKMVEFLNYFAPDFTKKLQEILDKLGWTDKEFHDHPDNPMVKVINLTEDEAYILSWYADFFKVEEAII